MNEKVVIEAKPYNFKKIRNILWVLGALATLVWALIYVLPAHQRSMNYWGEGFSVSFYLFHLLIPFGAFFVLGLVLYLWTFRVSLTVTDKRVYGTAGFGKRVDLPIDMISAVGTSLRKGIAVTTSSGVIKFVMIINRDEVHNAISELLMKRQDTHTGVSRTVVKQEVPQSNADELRKFKELLDSGVITQEEFDAKKKQLLGL